MLLNKDFPYNISSRVHVFIGICLNFFVLFIIFFLKPFNSGSSNFPFKTIYLINYGIITFVSYFITHCFSVLYYKKKELWKLFEEIIFCLIFIIISIAIGFFYTEIGINKKPERLNLNYFIGWFKTIFLGFGILLFFSAILLRKKYTKTDLKNKLKVTENEKTINSRKIKLTGSLKKEAFIISKTNLIYIKSENNYVRIFYFEDNLLKEKLFRSSLSNIHQQLSLFIKVHRSYIVNPNHILTLKGNKQNAKLYFEKINHNIPISQPFYDMVNSYLINHK